MKRVNVEKFLADYELAVKEKEDAVNAKENALNTAKLEAENMAKEKGWSEFVKNGIQSILIQEQEEKFDFSGLDAKLENFEKYLEDIVEETQDVEEHPVENSDPNTLEVRVDKFGNPIF